MSDYLIDFVFPAMRTIFIALALWELFYAGWRLVTEAENEGSEKEAKDMYRQIIYACAMVSLATFIVDAFGSSARATLVNPEPLNEGIGNMVFYFKCALAAIVTSVIVVQGFRLIVNIGEEGGDKSRAQKNLINSFFGVAVILVVDPIVGALFPGAGSVGLSEEVRGFANFLLTMFGALAVLSFVAAGVFLILSIDESLRERAKKVMLTAAVATAVILASYVLVNYFLSL